MEPRGLTGRINCWETTGAEGTSEQKSKWTAVHLRAALHCFLRPLGWLNRPSHLVVTLANSEEHIHKNIIHCSNVFFRLFCNHVTEGSQSCCEELRNQTRSG